MVARAANDTIRAALILFNVRDFRAFLHSMPQSQSTSQLLRLDREIVNLKQR
jgi:hypothetical protein